MKQGYARYNAHGAFSITMQNDSSSAKWTLGLVSEDHPIAGCLITPDELKPAIEATQQAIPGSVRVNFNEGFEIKVYSKQELIQAVEILLRKLQDMALIRPDEAQQIKTAFGITNFPDQNKIWCDAHKDELLIAGMTEEQFDTLIAAQTKDEVLEVYYDNRKLGESPIAMQHKRLAGQWEQSKGAVASR